MIKKRMKVVSARKEIFKRSTIRKEDYRREECCESLRVLTRQETKDAVCEVEHLDAQTRVVKNKRGGMRGEERKKKRENQ